MFFINVVKDFVFGYKYFMYVVLRSYFRYYLFMFKINLNRYVKKNINKIENVLFMMIFVIVRRKK